MVTRENGLFFFINSVMIQYVLFRPPGLSLLGYPGVKTIDAAYALPVGVVDRIFLKRDVAMRWRDCVCTCGDDVTKE